MPENSLNNAKDCLSAIEQHETDLKNMLLAHNALVEAVGTLTIAMGNIQDFLKDHIQIVHEGEDSHGEEEEGPWPSQEGSN